MTLDVIDQPGLTDLRLRARERLDGHQGPGVPPVSSSAALGVLHQLASSPATAHDALALLHELQVHQVEIELQAEELRGSRAELEAELQRQLQRYDGAPAGLFTLDADGTVHETNLTGASLLGTAREGLIGRQLGAFLAAHSARALRAMLERVAGGSRGEGGALELADLRRPAHVVQASVHADPAGSHVLLAMLDLRSFR